MQPTTLLSKEELVLLIQRAHNRRMFVAGDIKEYVLNLSEEKAFAISRILPKDILERLLAARDIGPFADKILDYHIQIAKEGPLVEVAKSKLADEQFLVTHSAELLKVMGDERY